MHANRQRAHLETSYQAWKIKNEKYLKTDNGTQKRSGQHEEGRKSTRTSQLVLLALSSHLTKIHFNHVILEDRQSFAANLMSASHT